MASVEEGALSALLADAVAEHHSARFRTEALLTR